MGLQLVGGEGFSSTVRAWRHSLLPGTAPDTQDVQEHRTHWTVFCWPDTGHPNSVSPVQSSPGPRPRRNRAGRCWPRLWFQAGDWTLGA